MNKKNRSPLKSMKCMSKRAYETEEVALNNIAMMDNGFKQTQKPYNCKNCGAWHTHTIRRKK